MKCIWDNIEVVNVTFLKGKVNFSTACSRFIEVLKGTSLKKARITDLRIVRYI